MKFVVIFIAVITPILMIDSFITKVNITIEKIYKDVTECKNIIGKLNKKIKIVKLEERK